jgi:glycine dehydrogenase
LNNFSTHHHTMAFTKFYDQFVHRHMGPSADETQQMLETIGLESLDALIDQTVPSSIRLKRPLDLPDALSETEYIEGLKKLAVKNRLMLNCIGLGYHATITPQVILRNIFENPGWYTQYTPYQAEISQGRLEALLNFQTMVSDLTGLPIANASLLDEGTAAAEAMTMFFEQRNRRVKGAKVSRYFVSENVFPQTLDVLRTRATPLGIEIVVGDGQKHQIDGSFFGVMLQYPDGFGKVEDYKLFINNLKNNSEIYVVVAADILALALLAPPGEWGADAVVGNTQRFGVPMGFGGPHAAYFATKDEFKRQMPGRIIGVSQDAQGKAALRMALQTREQHIKREKATSNICTAQALLAIMAGMYAAYHGPKGLRAIAERVHLSACLLAEDLQAMGFKNENESFFDTLRIDCLSNNYRNDLYALAQRKGVNFRKIGDYHLGISLDETTDWKAIDLIVDIFAEFNEVHHRGNIGRSTVEMYDKRAAKTEHKIPAALVRQSEYLAHPVFNSHHTETKMMRYIKSLENKDLSLMHSMIPLGSCTMKLNAVTELRPVSWELFANIHPFAPSEQTTGYQLIITELEEFLCEITGFDACSLQPNSGAQGEYTGLLVIRAYHEAQGDGQRKVALIPSSAHGTNPASAVMAGMQVVIVQCDEKGNIDVADLKEKAAAHSGRLACLMVTYPSTHGVFEEDIIEICKAVHAHGGLVYMDGANMNAQVGLTTPALVGADVCHLNLHKTFAIPHGGGGPGMGPICANARLAPFMPRHVIEEVGGEKGIGAVAAAPYGSASILLVSYAYIKLMGGDGLKAATEYAILNANYIKARLEGAYAILYTGKNGRCAHELIVDLRPFKHLATAEDVAKRLIDYGFHSPTLSFPVAGTLMIEPTESEAKDEMDRFCDALLQIREELDEIARGEQSTESNVLANAPHTLAVVTADEWTMPYSREKAAYPLPYLRSGHKFWPSVSRVDNALGDRHLVCTCPPISDYE